ncbi:glycosyltransferase [Paenibacillus qinlingensis]|uniref:REP element-mobilizing transposase RayT n=1 Tax=Paenibacillus qinlingensis TaxID=1837343 RepID=A0ABU1NYI9_9BACL|nr:glycosyltransferase [Paenibacillus qinlingensis]MDR6552548.1 REP element-mobilizing transposase RayT [Paenibacillus qinlingensis]
MKRRFLLVTLLVAMVLAFTLTPMGAQAAVKEPGSALCMNPSKVKLREDLRRLWIDHVGWTRSYIVSALAGVEDQKDVLARLLKNQQDIGDAIKPYYGDAAGNKLADLLREHIQLAGGVVDAAKAGNQADLAKFNKEWYRNADDLAKFLSGANPNWSQKEQQDMLYGHLKLITEQVTARLKKDWNADILAYDKGEDHMIMYADMLSDGIIKQFPDKFK